MPFKETDIKGDFDLVPDPFASETGPKPKKVILPGDSPESRVSLGHLIDGLNKLRDANDFPKFNDTELDGTYSRGFHDALGKVDDLVEGQEIDERIRQDKEARERAFYAQEPRNEKPVSIETRLDDLRMWIDTIDSFQKTHELTEEQKTIIEKELYNSTDQIAILLNQIVDWSKTAKRKQT